jgi:ABC-type branched-subunit amino acid transport system substrate-binding protein
MALLLAVLSAGGCSPAEHVEPPGSGADRPAEISGPSAARGREIYQSGRSPSGGTLSAVLGDATELPASALACANCHAGDGRGSPEGGIAPSDITWEALTKPYGGIHPSGRRYPPYDERLLSRAIGMGLDSAGHRLASTMPRYRMSHADMGDLVAYLRQVGLDADSGVSEGELRIGLLLPGGAADQANQVVREVLAAFFADVNRAGGVYGRQLRLCSEHLPDPPADRAEAVRHFLRSRHVLALAGGFLDQPDEIIAAVAEGEKVPVMGVLSAPPPGRSSSPRYVFYQYAGPRDQCLVLADFACQSDPRAARRLAVLSESGSDVDVLADTVRAECRRQGATIRHDRLAVEDADRLAAELHRSGIDGVFLLAPGATIRHFLTAAASRGWFPEVYLPAALAGHVPADSSPDTRIRVFLAFPTVRGDCSPAGGQEYERLAGQHGLPPRHRATQFAALSAAKLLVEALRRAGRDVRREKLVDALETISGLRTEFAPPLRFGPGRRIGARGAYVVQSASGGEFTPVGGWRELP